MTVQVTVEAEFLSALRKLPPDRRKAAQAALVRFVEDPSRASLKFRPLKTKASHFIMSSAHGDRIILRRDDEAHYAAVDVGPHDNVYRRWNRRW